VLLPPSYLIVVGEKSLFRYRRVGRKYGFGQIAVGRRWKEVNLKDFVFNPNDNINTGF